MTIMPAAASSASRRATPPRSTGGRTRHASAISAAPASTSRFQADGPRKMNLGIALNMIAQANTHPTSSFIKKFHAWYQYAYDCYRISDGRVFNSIYRRLQVVQSLQQ